MSEHAIREYLKTIGNGGGGVPQETDPVFTASPAHGISAQDIADWNDKQDELVSGTNIKTINGQSLLGSGDLPVAPPVTSTDVPTADTISEFDSDAHMNSADMTSQAVSDFVDGLNVSGNTDLFTRKQKASSITAAANTTGDVSITVTDAKLKLVVGVAIGGTDRLSVAQCYFESDTSIKCRVINVSAYSQTGTFTVFYL